MIDIYTSSVIGFFLILAILIYRDRKNIEIKYILFMRRTKKGVKFLDKAAKPVLFWKIVGTIGIFIALYLMITGIFTLSDYGIKLLTREVKAPSLKFVLPTPTAEPVVSSGLILLPFWFWIIIIASVIFPHEFMHGILSRVEKIKVKSVGLLLLGIFPGAFVEPDEKQIKKSGFWTKMRIFAAGGFANFLLASLLFMPGFNFGIASISINHGILPDILWPHYVKDGLVINETNATGPSAEAGLTAGMVLTEINGQKVTPSYIEYLIGGQWLEQELADVKPGDLVQAVADNRVFYIKVGEYPNITNRPYLGITASIILSNDSESASTILFPLLTWMWELNLAIAIVNLAPIYPLDGGLMVEALVEKVSKKYARKITIAITMIMLFIFFINFATPFLLD